MFRLKELREENGLKRSELARDLNINAGTIANYENEIIDFETLLKGLIYKKTSSQYSFHTEKGIRLLRKADD